MKDQLLKIIESEITKLDMEDAEGHIWWNHFKDLIEPLPDTDLEQEQFNHSMTRIAWDKTSQERDDLRILVKVFRAIKSGLEAQVDSAHKELDNISKYGHS